MTDEFPGGARSFAGASWSSVCTLFIIELLPVKCSAAGQRSAIFFQKLRAVAYRRRPRMRARMVGSKANRGLSVRRNTEEGSSRVTALPRFTIIDTFSGLGRLRMQRMARVPDSNNLERLLEACDRGRDFDEILGGPTRPGSRPLDTQALAKKLKLAMQGSAVVVIAYEDVTPLMRGISMGSHEGKIVGMARAVTDGSLVATVHDVLVHPDYRKRGIGRQMLQMICRYLDTNMDVIDVGTTCYRQGTKEFLSKAGFGDDEEGSTAMVWAGQEEEMTAPTQVMGITE